jgi:hypothetical protein
MRGMMVCVAAAIWQCATLASAEYSLPKDLAPGQPYQLVFFTDGNRDCMSPDIGAYNQFVSDEAALHPELPATEWRAIMSVYDVVWARDNAPTYEGIPVYNTRGERVSDGSPVTAGATVRTDFYDTQNDPHHAGIYDPDGNPIGVNAVATGSFWTGSGKYEAGAPPYYYWGWPFYYNPITVGLPDRLDDGWIDCGMDDGSYAANNWAFYGLSSVVTMPAPEPSTLALLGIAAVSVLGLAWRRRKRALTPLALVAAMVACACPATAVAAEVIAGPISNPSNGNLYYLLSQDNWTGAEATAQSLQGHLATVNSAAENQWIFDTFSSYGGVNRLLWIGLHDTTDFSDWAWAWASGAPVVYTNFSPAEPNSEGYERWVYMYPNGMPVDSWQRYPGTWNNYSNYSTELGGPIYAVAQVAPEPSSFALLGIGGFGLLAYAWRKRKPA